MRAYTAAVAALSFGLNSVSAFAPSAGKTLIASHARVVPTTQSAALMAGDVKVFDQEAFIAESKEMRLKHLEEQAMFALKIAVENYGNAVFPNALIAGDVVITHLLHRMGYLESGKAKVMVVDTFHLFPETMEFLREIEEYYGFKAEVFLLATKQPLTKNTAPTFGRKTLNNTTRFAKWNLSREASRL